MSELLDTLLQGVVLLVCPPRANCMGCGSRLGNEEGWLCPECKQLLEPLYTMTLPRCPRCGRPLDEKGRCLSCKHWPAGVISYARSVYIYERPISGIIRSFKYGGIYRMADSMAEKMVEMMDREHFDRPDALIAVPMHKKRFLARGLDHALLLARALGGKTGIAVAEGRLKRIYNTRQQAKMRGRERSEAMDGVFTARDVTGMRILLVDDVVTTGATALECARTLRKAGAADVQLITLAGAVVKGLPHPKKANL